MAMTFCFVWRVAAAPTLRFDTCWSRHCRLLTHLSSSLLLSRTHEPNQRTVLLNSTVHRGSPFVNYLVSRAFKNDSRHFPSLIPHRGSGDAFFPQSHRHHLASRQLIYEASRSSFVTSSSSPNNSSSCSTSSATETTKKENIATIPNMLTASRMVLSPVIGYLVVSEMYTPAMVFFAIAGFTDLLDGYIARNFPGQASTLGMAIDPLADKLLMTIMTLSLTWADLFPTTLTVLIITRDVLLIASGFALRYFSLSPPITLKRYFDISLPSAEVYPTFSSKVNTAVQLVAVAASLAAPLASLTESPMLKALWILAGATTVWSGASYAYNGASCFKILSEENKDGGGGGGSSNGGKVSMKEIQMMGGVGFSLGLAFVCWKSF